MAISIISDDSILKRLLDEIQAGKQEHMTLASRGLAIEAYWKEVGYIAALDDILEMERTLRAPAPAPTEEEAGGLDDMPW